MRLLSAILLTTAALALSGCQVYNVEPGADRPPETQGNRFPGDTNGKVVITYPMLDQEYRQKTAPAATDDEVRKLTQVRVYLECGDLATTSKAVRMMTIFQVAAPAAAVGDHTMGLPKRCRAGTVREGGWVRGYSIVKSSDGGFVEVIAYDQPNADGTAFFPITFARPVTKYYGRGIQLWF